MSSASFVRREHRHLPSTLSPRRVLATVACMAALAMVAACDDDDEPVGPDVEGRYELIQVNSQDLPVRITLSTGDEVTVTSVSATVDAGTYEGLVSYSREQDVCATTSTIPLAGEYTVEDDQVEFDDNNTLVEDFDGTFEEDVLTATITVETLGIRSALLTLRREE